MPGIRTFVAIPLPEEVRASLAELRSALPPAPPGLRWGRVEQAHLTLVFLGDLDETAVASACRAVREAAGAARPFAADLSGLGAFPRPDRARVVWVGWGAGAAEATALQAVVARALAAAMGDRGDDRPFAPHVTVARTGEPLDLRAHLAAGRGWRGPPWRVDAIDVLASDLRPSGAVHRVLMRCPLGGVSA